MSSSESQSADYKVVEYHSAAWSELVVQGWMTVYDTLALGWVLMKRWQS